MKFPMFCKTPSLGKRGDLRGGLEQTLVADSTYTVRVAALGAGQSSWFSPGEARFVIQVFRGRGGVVVAQAERSQRECATLRDILAHAHGLIAVPEPPRGGGLLPGGGEAKAANRVRDWCFRLLQTPELTSDPHTSRFFGGLLEDSAAPEEQGGALQRAQSDNVLVRQRERTRVELPRQRSANQLFRPGASHAFAAPPEVPAAVAEAPPAVREQEGLAPATPQKGTTPAPQGVQHLVGGGVAHEGHLWFGAGGGGGGGSPLGGAESSSRASLNTTLSGREGALSREGMLSAKTTVANTPMATDEDIRTALLKSVGHIEWDSGESLGASPEPPPRSLDAPDLSRLRTLLVDILPRTSSAETRETDLSEEPPSGARTGRTAYTYSLSRSQSADPPTWRSEMSATEYAASSEGPLSPLLRSTGPLIWGDEVLVDEAAAAEACGGGHLASLAASGPLLCPSLVASCEVY